MKNLGFARACIYNWLARSCRWMGTDLKPASTRVGQRNCWQNILPGFTELSVAAIRSNCNFHLCCGPSNDCQSYQNKFGINLSVTSVGRLLHQLGFTCDVLFTVLSTGSGGGSALEKLFFQRSKKKPRRRELLFILRTNPEFVLIFIPGVPGP